MIISEAFDVKNYCSALFCSGSTLERVSSFLKKFRRQLTSLGHAGSPCFLSFCYLRCIVLTWVVYT